MARKVDAHQTFLVRASADDAWELWTVPDGRTAQFIQRVASPAEAPGPTVVALPAQQVLSFPVWVSTADREVAAEVLRLRLEEQGLVHRASAGVAMDFRLLPLQENRCVAVATVLQPELPEELAFEKATRFEPSAFTVPLPPDRLTIWRERGRITFTITRGSEAVYQQATSGAALSPELLQELKCVLLQLEGQRLINPLGGAVLWGDFSDDEALVLRKRLGLRTAVGELPAPALPKQQSRLLPPQVEALHLRKRRRDRMRRLLTGALVVYLGLLALLAGYIWWEQSQVERLQRSLAAEAPTVRAVEQTADRWRNVQWAVDPHVYPVELLQQIASLLPAEGMRLTAFEVQKGKVVVRGEASTAPAAFKLAEDVKSKPELQMFTWQMPSPSLRPDGRAEFTIEGEPKFAKIN